MNIDSEILLKKTLCLVGLMGCGKSTIGEYLSKSWQLPFYDSDEEIERSTGMLIAEIFKQKGESVFRDLERKSIVRLLDRPIGILSTGGGAFIEESTRKILLERTECIYLRISAETTYQRVKGLTHRPLLQTEDPLGTLKKLLKDRDPFYCQAPYVIETEGLSLEEVVQAIQNRF